MKKIASIDLGTNTFHLLIVAIDGSNYKEVHRERIYVNLAEDGIYHISTKIKTRIDTAISKFKISLDEYEVSQYKAIGTAGLRTAANGSEIVDYIKSKYDIDIELISGEEEANLIFKGVQLAYDFDDDSYLIMDIGGGSVEFIIVENNKMIWSASFKIGVTVLYNNFKGEDPFSKERINKINQYLKTKLIKLQKELSGRKIKYLVGASGSFDVVESILGVSRRIGLCSVLDLDQDYYQLFDKIVSSSLSERKEIKGIPLDRVKLIPIAMILIEFIVNISKPRSILISPYAMKEGMLKDMM